MTLTAPDSRNYESLQEAKEGMTDALVNMTASLCSGEGPEGEFIRGRRPERAFVSGFLLPRHGPTGDDETTDIRIALIGLDTQIVKSASGMLLVQPSFSVYVRTLPSWAELQDPRFELKPTAQLTREWDRKIKADHSERYLTKLKEHGLKDGRDPDLSKEERAERRALRKKLQAEAYKETLQAFGIELKQPQGSDSGTAIEPKPGANAEAEPIEPPETTEGDDAQSHAEPATSPPGEMTPGPIDARSYPLHMLRDLDIPMKWRRILLTLPTFEWNLTHDEGREEALEKYAQHLHLAIQQGVQAWLDTPEGRRDAWRNVRMKPHDWQAESSWAAFLDKVRQEPPKLDALLPDFQRTRLAISQLPDFTNPSRLSLRVALENNNQELQRHQASFKCPGLFQVKLSVTLPCNVHRPLHLDRVEPSYRFRDHLLYDAMGLNCGAYSFRQGEKILLETTWAPRWVQPRIEPRSIDVETSFAALAAPDFQVERLRQIASRYREWILDQQTRLPVDIAKQLTPEHAATKQEDFAADVEGWTREADLIDTGVTVLAESKAAYDAHPGSPQAAPWRAFVLMNRAFYERDGKNPKRGWRLFQLAFVLTHVPCLASRLPEFERYHDPVRDEDTASLLYFPTGGGKSEAFYGTLVFALFLDRLRGKLRGVTALVRYPLRLLTLQQAQRLMRLLVRAELVRRQEKLGEWPFEIGFWVGSNNTPNRASEITDVPFVSDSTHPDDRGLDPDALPAGADEDFARAYTEARAAFNKIPLCPICSEATGLRRIRGHGEHGLRVAIVCFNDTCGWNKAHPGTPRTELPFLLTDDTIYHRAPSVILGTVDKLALIGQRSETITRVLGMFGLARWITQDGHLHSPRKREELRNGPSADNCSPVFPSYHQGQRVFRDPFPSLIIQDEMHLLEESLGTFAGLFETTLEAVLRRIESAYGDKLEVARSRMRPGAPARMPKVIAATATVSDPARQLEAIYQRSALLFPRPGPDIHSSFFAIPQEPPQANTDRIRMKDELGPALAPEKTSPWMRLYVSIMTNGANHTVTTVSVLSAFHLVVTRIWRGLINPASRLETAQQLIAAVSLGRAGAWRRTALEALVKDGHFDRLIALVDLHRVAITYVTNKKGGDQVIDALDFQVRRDHDRAGLDIGAEFPSKLISGGVDMAVIQEIMKLAEKQPTPGAPYPDINEEGTLRNVVATSAISHGVDVERFNSMFFAGLPSNVAEYIQASSRVGRTHVGFVILVPTPQSRRDRYVVETHDIFHRFLERMIDPPAVERWAAHALSRTLPSIIQAWAMVEEATYFGPLPDNQKHESRSYDVIRTLTTGLLGAPEQFRQNLTRFVHSAFGMDGRGPNGLGRPSYTQFYAELISKRIQNFLTQLREEPSAGQLHEFWEDPRNGFMKPMTSLRDVEESGWIVGSPFHPPADIKTVMDFVRGRLKIAANQADEGAQDTGLPERT
ncbi:helicase domain-containing protein [Corallococcus coralloides DSM 2259]|uniref:Helicase domain-containing protein n=1 Tax=Corallococcus coralloides (strain ATCC 25202 / DSM 2259 / NBRC 100086 / M2) TaxID=1144275 RepID=H8MFA1_CORCM|nr:DEAD/DEAH box helicase family protein [Corallococcus coralloides]AFE05821.1 helicase domain-containing protein [Corallococcus coralloides DSM 2259]